MLSAAIFSRFYFIDPSLPAGISRRAFWFQTHFSPGKTCATEPFLKLLGSGGKIASKSTDFLYLNYGSSDFARFRTFNNCGLKHNVLVHFRSARKLYRYDFYLSHFTTKKPPCSVDPCSCGSSTSSSCCLDLVLRGYSQA